MDDLNEKAERLAALWKSGRAKYVSFFAVLADVRREIGDEALPSWCIEHLRIGISVISTTKKVLLKVDADIVKRDLAVASAAERSQASKARATERLTRELEKQEHARRIAEARAEAERAKTEAERAKAETKKARNTTRRKKPDAGQRERRRRMLIATISDAKLSDLVRRFRKAEALCQEGERQWVDGSVAIALILHAVRIKIPGNQEFGAWLEANNIYPGVESRDVRTALIGLGGLGEVRLREILIATDSRSYRCIWAENRVVEPLSQRFDNAEERESVAPF